MVLGAIGAGRPHWDTRKCIRILNAEILLVQVSFKHPASQVLLKKLLITSSDT